MLPSNQPLLPSSGHPPAAFPPSVFAPPPSGEDGNDSTQIARLVSALLRFKWLVVAIAILGGCAGFVLSRFVHPAFYVESTIWISQETPQAQAAGPTRQGDALLEGSSWPELLKSYSILDEVVRENRMYLYPRSVGDSALFKSFDIADAGVRPGYYELVVTADGRGARLEDRKGNVLDSLVAPGDSVGRRFGLLWAPAASEYRPKRKIGFSVFTLRDASINLRDRLETRLAWGTNILHIGMRGTDPKRMAGTLNSLVDRFVLEAATLKKRNLVGFVGTLEAQVGYAETELQEAEAELQAFGERNVGTPSTGGASAAVTLGTGGDPVMRNYYQERVERDQLQQDIMQLERAVTGLRTGTMEPDALWSVGAIQLPTEAPDLRAALTELSSREAQLRAARVTMTDSNAVVKEHIRAVNQLRRETIPQLATQLLRRWRMREGDLGSHIASASAQLRNVPAQAIEDMRLRRNVEMRQNLYRTLKNRLEEARLTEVSSVPDVSVLDRAVAPVAPTSNTAPKLMLMALFASIGFGCGLAILLDRLDRRVMYPEQVTNDMKLGIVGAVPRASRKQHSKSVEEAANFVEAFRTLRVNLQYALPRGGPIRLAVSSPGQGDGKSFVSSNLALSFAEAGYRTLLLDGDTRRGELHTTFGADRLPGLVDYLAGGASLEDILRPTTQERLTLVPCGKRIKRSPELLASQRLLELLAELQSRFDVVIVDTPPLGAGVDAFVMSIATQHLVLVLRNGQTDRKLAESKLELLDRLPVTVLGAVLNDVPNEGHFKYYSYLPGYEAEEEDTALLRG